MPQLESTRSVHVFYPVVVTAAVAAFLLRGRQIVNSNSPGSGVTIAGSEVLMRMTTLLQSALSIGDHALSLLFRVAFAPANFALSVMGSEFRIAVTAIDGVVSFLHAASVSLLRVL